MRYRVEFEDGTQIDVNRHDLHPGYADIIESATIERARVQLAVSTPVRIFRIALGAVGEDIGIESCVWTGPRSKRIEPKKVRIFVSFAYRPTDMFGEVVSGAVFGSTMLDIEFEPAEPDHIEFVQQLIQRETGRQSVVLLGWQRVGA